MKLTDLEPEFIRYLGGNRWMFTATTYYPNEADGIAFKCPKCSEQLICWSSKISTEVYPGPNRFHILGTNFSDMTLKGTISDLIPHECEPLFFIENGYIHLHEGW